MVDRDGGAGLRANAKNAESLLQETLHPKEGQSYHAAIAEATTRIGRTLTGLYNAKSDNKKPSKYEPDSPKERKKKERAHSRGSDSGSPTSPEPGSPRKAEKEASSDDEEHWNLDEAKQTVKDLLNSLQTEKRTEEMDNLRVWFESKAKVVPQEEDELKRFLSDCVKGENTHKSALLEIEADVSDKVEAKEKGLKRFEAVLNTMVKQGRSTAQEWKSKQAQLERDKAELVIDNDQLVRLEDSIQELRQKLLLKESDANGDDDKKNAADLEEKDILAVINAQEKELKSLNARWDVNERRVKMLRVAFHYVSNGAVGPAPAEMVVDTLEEMKTQIRSTKIVELLQAADVENAHLLEPPDDSEVKELEQTCIDLQEQLEDIETQVALLQTTEERQRELQQRLDSISGGQGGGIPEDMQVVTAKASGQMTSELLQELALVQDRNAKLQPKLQQYSSLLANSEETLDTLENERLKFMELVNAAKSNLEAEFDIDEDLLSEMDADLKDRIESRRKEVRNLLNEEAKETLKGADNQQLGVKAALTALQDEQRRVRELGWEFEKQQDEMSEFDVPQVTRQMIQESQGKPAHKLMKLKADPVNMSSKVAMVRAQLEEDKKAAEAEALAAQEEAAELEAADAEDQPKDDGTKKDVEADEDKEAPEEGKSKTKTADFEGFIRLHNENLELVQELEDIETQLRALKSARGHPLDFGREGAMTAGPEDVLEEIKQRQQELFDAREKWWNMRQEPPRVASAASPRTRKGAGSRHSTIEDDDPDQPVVSRNTSKKRSSKAEHESEDGPGSKEGSREPSKTPTKTKRHSIEEDDGQQGGEKRKTSKRRSTTESKRGSKSPVVASVPAEEQ